MSAPFLFNCTPRWVRIFATPPDGFASTSVGLKGVETQTVVKTRRSNGSIAQAFMIAKILTAGDYELEANPPVTSAVMDAPVWPAASVRFVDQGVQYVAQLPAYTEGEVWSKGPLAIVQRLVLTPKDPTGKPHHLVQVKFDVSSFNDGSTRIVYAATNSRDVVDDAAVQMTGLTYTLGSNNVYGPVTYKLFHGQIAIKSGTTGGFIASRCHPPSEMFYQHGIWPRISPLIGNSTILDSSGPTYDIGQFGEFSDSQPAPGGRWELGPVDDILAYYLAHGGDDKQDRIIANGRCAASWDGYLMQADGVTPNRLTENLDYMPYKGGFEQYHALNPPHLPSVFVAPYLLTGDRIYLDLMQSWAAFTCSDCWNDPLQSSAAYSTDYIVQYGRHANGQVCNMASSFAGEVRGLGRGLRMIVDAALCTPDSEIANKAYFNLIVSQNIQWLDNNSRLPGLGYFNFPIAWADPGNGSGYGAVRDGFASISYWQHYELLFAFQHAITNGFASDGGYVRQVAGSYLSLFTAAPESAWPLLASLYYPRVAVHPIYGAHTFFQTWDQFYAANYQGQFVPGIDFQPLGSPGPPYYVPQYYQIIKQARALGLPGAQKVLDWFDATFGGLIRQYPGYSLVDAGEALPPPPPQPPPDPPGPKPMPTYTMTAEIWTANENDPDHSDNKASVSFTSTSSAQPPPPQRTAALAIIKPLLSQGPPSGQPFTVSWGCRNTGPDGATGVMVFAPIAAGLTFVRAVPSKGTYTSDNGRWVVGEIAPGATETLDLITVAP